MIPSLKNSEIESRLKYSVPFTFSLVSKAVDFDLAKALKQYDVKSVSIGYTNMPPYKQPLFKEKLAHAFHCKNYNGKNNNYPDGLCPVAEKTIPNIILAYIFGEEEYIKRETERFYKAVNSLK